MKPFNLKEALEGKPVVTRNNLSVTQLTLFETDNIYPLRAVIERCVCEFTTGGLFHNEALDHKYDLFMATEKKSIWINVYLDKDGQITLSHKHYSIESALRSTKTINWSYIKTIEITNEIEL